jgi:DNA polymerase III epsilon subunit-like protein
MNNANCHEKRLVVVDVETTGLSTARGGRVIEVGAVA